MRISDWSSDVCSSDLTAGRILYRARPAVGLAARRWGDLPAPAHLPADPLYPRTAADRFFDRLVRSGDAEALRTARPFRRAAPHFGLRAAARLQLQPRWLDDVCELRDDLHRTGLWHRIVDRHARSEEHTSELQSLMRISYAVFCLK